MLRQQSSFDGNTMGTFSTRKHRNANATINVPGPVDFTRWKKHFWVCNTRERRLDYFKNDQTLVKKGSLFARDIVGVNSKTDRTNKFFDLVVTTRQEKQGRDFRFRTQDERDQWQATIVDMMASTKNVDQVSSMMSLVRQRLEEGMRELGGDILLETNVASLAEIPSEMHTSYLEGLDRGVKFVRRLSSQLRRTGLGLHALKKVAFIINAGDRPKATSLSELAADGTHYDPQSKTLALCIFLTKDPLGMTDVTHIDDQAALSLLSSSVYRDPQYEGWLALDRAAAAEKDRIAHLLQIPSFQVNLQWAPTVGHDEAHVRKYFTNHVNSKLLQDVYSIFQVVFQQDSSRAGFSTQEPYEGNDQTRLPTASGPSTPKRNRTPLNPGRTAGGASTGDDYSPAGSPVVLRVVDCIRACVSGIGITVTSGHVRNNEPPEVTLLHQMWADPFYLPAIALTSGLRQHGTNSPTQPETLPESLKEMISTNPTLDHFCRQIFEVIRYGRIAAACDEAEQQLTNTLGVDEGVEVSWERLTAVLAAVGCEFDEEHLPQLIRSVIAPYKERATHLVAMLRSFNLYETFQLCVSGCKVGFQAHDEARASPTVYMGVFYETMILCVPGTTAATALKALSDVGEPKPVEVRYPPGLAISFDPSYLTAWFRGYFSHPGNIVEYPKKSGVDDADAESDDSDNDGLDTKEAVALQRREEYKVLRRDDVINLAYDEQGDMIEYKVSAEAIARGVDAIERCFPDSTPRLHDLRRILVHALARLRQLFAEKAATLMGPVMLFQHVKDILFDYCDYRDSEEMIPTSLSPKLLPGPFQAAAAVVLNTVLPNELKHAVRSRRDILLVGLGDTGKTLITQTLRGQSGFALPHATVGRTEVLVAYREWLFSMNEIGGRPDFRTNWQHYLNLCPERLHGLIFVVDSAQKSQLREAQVYYQSLLKHPKLKSVPVLILANNAGGDRAVDAPTLKDFFEVDSKNGPGRMDNAFLSSCEAVLPDQGIDDGLAAGMDWLCGAVGDRCATDEHPSIPKTVESTPVNPHSSDSLDRKDESQ